MIQETSINIAAFLDEILELKNKIIQMEMKEKEIKNKFMELKRLLSTDRAAANKIYAEINEWAKT